MQVGGLPKRYFWYPRARLLWCAVCKSGMKSLEKVFRDIPGGTLLVGYDSLNELPKSPSIIAQFAREPKDRLISMYEYFFGRDRFQHPMPDMEDEQVAEWYDHVWGGLGADFATFVQGLPDVQDNHHFRPQWSEHLDMATARIRLDKAQQGWDAIRARYAPGLPMKFPHRNRTERTRDVASYWAELGDQEKEIYRTLYETDELFYRLAQPQI